MLFVGAFVFAAIEDPPVDTKTKLGGDYIRIIHKDVPLSHYNPANFTNRHDSFWFQIKYKYGITLPKPTRNKFLKEMRLFIAEERQRRKRLAYNKEMSDRTSVVMKWFYFLTIASTTIGYGDISPTTENGKLFYMIFSIFGIGVMMTLLGRCGTIVSAGNNKFFYFIKEKFCSNNNSMISEELLSVISISSCFFFFLVLGYWHRGAIKDTEISIISYTYYWIVTFTTVGFGDMYLYTFEEEVTHIFVLLLYRLFGLSIVSGIIASVENYVSHKQGQLREKTRILAEARKAIMERKLSVISDSTNYPKFAIERNLSTLERQKVRRYPEDYVDKEESTCL